MRVQNAGTRRPNGTFRKALGIGELPHRPVGQSHAAADSQGRLASGDAVPDLVVECLPARLTLGAGRPFRAATGKRACPPRRAGRPTQDGRQAPERTMHRGEPALGHLSQVQQQVPAIGDLHGPRRSKPDATGVLGRTVTGNSPNPTMTPKPVGQGRGGPVRQQVDHATTLQVDQDRPVGLALPPGQLSTQSTCGAGRRDRGKRRTRRSSASQPAAACGHLPCRLRQHRPVPAPPRADPYAVPVMRSGRAAAPQRSAVSMPDCGSTAAAPPVRGELGHRGRADRRDVEPRGCGQHGLARHNPGSGRSAVEPQRQFGYCHVSASDLPDAAPWKEMKVCHSRTYRLAGGGAATRPLPGTTNHASCGIITEAGQLQSQRMWRR